jgi:1-acyl-sn-glycerol-3-phosphate acyltransferase
MSKPLFVSLSNPRISPFLYPFVGLFMRALTRTLAPRFVVTGRHNIPPRGALIFAPNHISDVDPPFIGAALRYPIRFMAKRELWKIGWLGWVLDFVGSFPVDPFSPDRAALRAAADILKNNEAIVIFPEGRLSEDGELAEILPGVLSLALKSGVTIVPVGIAGLSHVMPYGKTVPRISLKHVGVHFGPPLDFKDLSALSGKNAREQARGRLEAAILEATATAKRSG